MTSKLKCTFCQHELLCIGILHAQDNHTIWYCPKCATKKQLWRIANKELWQALIQAKQDLEFFKEEQNRAATALIERTKELDKCQKDLEIARKALEDIVLEHNANAHGRYVVKIAEDAIAAIEHKE